MKRFLAAAIFAGSLLFTSSVNAEVQTYIGTDEYVMSEFETIDIAKQRAKQKAERAAQEQAGVFIESNTEVINMQVTKDEIVTMTGGILKIVDVQYDQRALPNVNGFVIRATVKADIDSDDITRWLYRDKGERSELVEHNIKLQNAIAAQDKKIAELKAQLSNAETKQEQKKISQQFKAEDKVFLSNQKMEEGMKFYSAGDLRNTSALCTQAIELNSDNALAYSLRGIIFYLLKDYNGAISDLNRAVALNPSDYKNFYNRGLAYVKLENYRAAAENFSGAIKLNPSDADSWYNRALCKQRLGNYYEDDLRKARSLGYSD